MKERLVVYRKTSEGRGKEAEMQVVPTLVKRGEKRTGVFQL